MYFEIDDFNGLKGALRETCDRLQAEAVPEETVFVSKLVANELLSNVLQHDGGRAYFIAALEGDEIRLCVRGSNGYRPPERSALSGAFEERGRGLFLVDAFCERRDWSDRDGIRVYIRVRKNG